MNVVDQSIRATAWHEAAHILGFDLLTDAVIRRATIRPGADHLGAVWLDPASTPTDGVLVALLAGDEARYLSDDDRTPVPVLDRASRALIEAAATAPKVEYRERPDDAPLGDVERALDICIGRVGLFDASALLTDFTSRAGAWVAANAEAIRIVAVALLEHEVLEGDLLVAVLARARRAAGASGFLIPTGHEGGADAA